MDFSKFDEKVNIADLKRDIEEAEKNAPTGDYPEIPDGSYIVSLVKLEIGETGPKSKVPGSPILKAQFKILEGEFAKQRIFYNKVLYGTKNDGNMINSAMGFLKDLDSGLDIIFESYSQFNDLVLDVAEEIDKEKLQYEITYKADAFNSVKIDEVYEA